MYPISWRAQERIDSNSAGPLYTRIFLQKQDAAHPDSLSSPVKIFDLTGEESEVKYDILPR
jgi:hypothetical protein